MKADVLVWAGMSDTTSPGEIGPFINQLVSGAAREMRKHGLIRVR